jgi:hypothetical protein
MPSSMGNGLMVKVSPTAHGTHTEVHSPARTPSSSNKSLTLWGGYIVPPFGEAHTHNVEGEWNIDAVIQHYVRDSIFYVKNPNDIPEFVEHIRHKLNKPDPSQSSAILLTQEDAKLAAKHQTVVVTTTVAGDFHLPGQAHHNADDQSHSSASSHGHERRRDDGLRDVARGIQVKNLQLLHQAGVKIAIGSDHAETALAEALHLHDLGIFDNLTLLKLWCETTPQTIFPFRKIGRLDEGYEASFLVLSKNPLTDFRHVQKINYRFKQGFPFSWEPVSQTHANAQKFH